MTNSTTKPVSHSDDSYGQLKSVVAILIVTIAIVLAIGISLMIKK